MISIIIPTYKEPQYLDICLKSLISQNAHESMEIIVVVDGFYDINKDVLLKYPQITVLNLEQNSGGAWAMNVGAYHANGEYLLFLNDDNVVGENFVNKLNTHLQYINADEMLTLNTIEPFPSMFPNMIHKNFGENSQDFNYDEFMKYSATLVNTTWLESGSIFPILLSKKNFMKVGGFPQEYPTNDLFDWDFFNKLELANVKGYLLQDVVVYHFVGKSAKNRDNATIMDINKFNVEAESGRDWYKTKWGIYPTIDKKTNSRLPKNIKLNGIKYK